MSFSCILYPAVGSPCTQLLGSIVPCPLGSPPTYSLGTRGLLRWVRLGFFVGYNYNPIGLYSSSKEERNKDIPTFRYSL